MSDEPQFAFVYLSPERCLLIEKGVETNSWTSFGEVDRNMAQRVISALNFEPNRKHALGEISQNTQDC